MSDSVGIIKKGGIYLSRSALVKAGFREGERVIIRTTTNGICIAKYSLFAELESFFSELDKDLQKLFIKEKGRELK